MSPGARGSGGRAERRPNKVPCEPKRAPVIVEDLEAARAAGLEDWLTAHIAEDLARQDASALARIVAGIRQHAVRRGREMAAAAEMLTDLGVEPIMAAAS